MSRISISVASKVASRYLCRVQGRELVPGEGIEPPTFGLQNRCSTAELTRRGQLLRSRSRRICHLGKARPSSRPCPRRTQRRDAAGAPKFQRFLPELDLALTGPDKQRSTRPGRSSARTSGNRSAARTQDRGDRARLVAVCPWRSPSPAAACRSSASTSTRPASRNLRAGHDRTPRARTCRPAAPDACVTTAIRRRCAAADFFIVTVPTPIDDGAAARSRRHAVGVRRRSAACSSAATSWSTNRRSIRARSRRTACRCWSRPPGLKRGAISPSAIRPSASIPATRRTASRPSSRWCRRRTRATLDIVADVYGSVVTAGIHRAPSIKVAEAAKVIENTQRDLNIAFMNELSAIFHVLGIDTGDVLAAARTKWNFLPFQPGPGRRPLHRRRSVLSHPPRREGRLPSGGDPRRAAASTTRCRPARRARMHAQAATARQRADPRR